MPLPIRIITLKRGDRKALEAWVRGRTTPRRLVERARIVLASADPGQAPGSIAVSDFPNGLRGQGDQACDRGWAGAAMQVPQEHHAHLLGMEVVHGFSWANVSSQWAAIFSAFGGGHA